MRKFTLFLLLLVAMLPLQNVKADKIPAYGITSNITANYQGTVSNTVDDNRDSFWWTGASQNENDHITMEIESAKKIGDIMLFFTGGDTPDGAAVEISTDNAVWNPIATFGNSDIVKNKFICNANGAEAKYIRMRITTTTGKWLQFAEFEVYEYIDEARTISVEALEGGTATVNDAGTEVTTTEIVTISATPNEGYQFYCWKVGEEIVSYNCTYEDRSAANKKYTAVFVETPEWSKSEFYFKCKSNNEYLTVKQYNTNGSTQKSFKTEAKNGSNDQIFILEPAAEYQKYYVKSKSGQYMNCASWNAYSHSTEKTTPILFNEVENGVYSLFQEVSTHKHGYLHIQSNNENGLYCDQETLGDNGKWILEVLTNKTQLQSVITEAEELLNRVAVFTKEQEQINIGGKISSNAGQNVEDGNTGISTSDNDGAGIAGLTDNDPSTYFHSRWKGTAVNEDHYLQINLGEENKLKDFRFEYAVRKGADANSTSPAPTAMEIRVSTDGTTFGDPIASYTTTANNLPTHRDLGQTLWLSEILSTNEAIQAIRITVTNSAGPGGNSWNNHHFFGMGTLNLYSVRDVVTINSNYSNLTTDVVIAAKEALKTANYTNESSAATQAQVDAAANELATKIQAIKAAMGYTLNVTAAGWATLYLGFPAEIPTNEGFKAYVVSEVTKNAVTLTQVQGVLPANEAIIVEAPQGSYTFLMSADAATEIETNYLEGTTTDECIEGPAYILGIDNGVVGLYNAELDKNATGGAGNTHFISYANKAYLPASAVPAALQGAASFSFRYEGTTSIEEVETENAVKAIYDLTGRKVNEITAPGIYIVGGKKVLVK